MNSLPEHPWASQAPQESRRKPVVAILTDIFQKGGVERVVSYMSSRLFRSGEGFVILFDDSRIDFDYQGTIVTLNVPPPPYASVWREASALLQALWKLARLKRTRRIDLCISHKEGPNFINILSGFSTAIVVVHEHKSTGIKHAGLSARLVRYLIRTLYNRAHHVVTVSEMIARDLVLNFGINEHKIKVVRNPCDLSAIHQQRDEPLESAHSYIFDSPVIITMGRLVQQKAQWHLIRAFAHLKNDVKDATLVILGEGPESTYLHQLVAALDIASSVHFLGFQSNPFKFVRRADVFALTSLWEGFPLVLLEAMACEIPIVASDGPSGLKELLAPELPADVPCTGITRAQYGILTPPIDGAYRSAVEPLTDAELCLATAMRDILDNPELHDRYKGQGTKRVEDFSLDAYAAQWSDLLRAAYSSRSS